MRVFKFYFFCCIRSKKVGEPTMTEKGISERYICLVFYYESAIDARLAKMVSLAELAKRYSEKSLGYAIQSWMCSRNTLRFLHQWENDVNEEFDDAAYEELLH